MKGGKDDMHLQFVLDVNRKTGMSSGDGSILLAVPLLAVERDIAQGSVPVQLSRFQREPRSRSPKITFRVYMTRK